MLGFLRGPGPETKIPQVKVKLMDIQTVSDSSALAHVASAHSPEVFVFLGDPQGRELNPLNTNSLIGLGVLS